MMIDFSNRQTFAKGQIWQTRLAEFEIMALNGSFVYYKVTKRLGQRRSGAQISGIEAMTNYLRTNQAKLVTTPLKKACKNPVTSRRATSSRLAQ